MDYVISGRKSQLFCISALYNLITCEVNAFLFLKRVALFMNKDVSFSSCTWADTDACRVSATYQIKCAADDLKTCLSHTWLIFNFWTYASKGEKLIRSATWDFFKVIHLILAHTRRSALLFLFLDQYLRWSLETQTSERKKKTTTVKQWKAR